MEEKDPRDIKCITTEVAGGFRGCEPWLLHDRNKCDTSL